MTRATHGFTLLDALVGTLLSLLVLGALVAGVGTPAAAMSSSVSAPSLAVVWLWKTPRMSVSSTNLGSGPAAAASTSPVFSRSSGGM